ncbi:hypothetical protein AB0J52_11070 [Spirillospora sp. NPDC049652]
MTQSMRWQGGANIPSAAFGRMTSSWPRASLTLNHSTLVLKFVLSTFTLTPADVAVIYPCGGFTVSGGLGIQTTDGQVLVFWTTETPTILPALEAAGFPVSPEPRPVYQEIRASQAPRKRGTPTSGKALAIRAGLFLVGLLWCVLSRPFLAPHSSLLQLLVPGGFVLVVSGVGYYIHRNRHPTQRSEDRKP